MHGFGAAVGEILMTDQRFLVAYTLIVFLLCHFVVAFGAFFRGVQSLVKLLEHTSKKMSHDMDTMVRDVLEVLEALTLVPSLFRYVCGMPHSKGRVRPRQSAAHGDTSAEVGQMAHLEVGHLQRPQVTSPSLLPHSEVSESPARRADALAAGNCGMSVLLATAAAADKKLLSKTCEAALSVICNCVVPYDLSR